MKFSFLLLAVVICFFVNGQSKTSGLETYLSKLQINEADMINSKQSIKIIVNKQDASISYAKFIDLDDNKVIMTLKIKYWKTIKDEDGTTKWFYLYGSKNFNICKICTFLKPNLADDYSYKSGVILSYYDVDGNRVKDLGFFGNKIN